eukprot:15415003-Alexandrium_andersonii.AAC.1
MPGLMADPLRAGVLGLAEVALVVGEVHVVVLGHADARLVAAAGCVKVPWGSPKSRSWPADCAK